MYRSNGDALWSVTLNMDKQCEKNHPLLFNEEKYVKYFWNKSSSVIIQNDISDPHYMTSLNSQWSTSADDVIHSPHPPPVHLALITMVIECQHKRLINGASSLLSTYIRQLKGQASSNTKGLARDPSACMLSQVALQYKIAHPVPGRGRETTRLKLCKILVKCTAHSAISATSGCGENEH
jgi:hypothetical protein